MNLFTFVAMRIITLTCLLFASICTCAKPPGLADSILQKMQQVSNDTLRIDSIYHLAKDIVDQSPKDALQIGKALLLDAQAHNYRYGMANANKLLAIACEYISDYPKCLQYNLDALALYKELKQPGNQIDVMLAVSRVYDATGDHEGEKRYIGEAWSVAQQNKSIPKVRKMQPSILDYLATVYKQEGRYDTSIRLYEDAIAMAKQENDLFEQMSSLCNLAIAYKSNKNFTRSMDAYHEVLSLMDTAKDVFYYAVVLDNMGILYYEMGDMARAEQTMLHALSLHTNDPSLLRDAYETLTKVYTKEKRYAEALGYMTKLSAVKDSVLNREKAQAIAQWQTKFDTETKDKQIADQKKELEYNRKITLSLILSTALFLLLGLIIYRNYKVQKKYNAIITREKQRSEDLLLNILPEEVAEELKDTGSTPARHFDNVTVLFTDFVNFTRASERMNPQQLINELHYCFKAFDDIVDKYNIEKIKTIGDSYLAVSGLPVSDPHHAENIIKAALEINEFVRRRREQLGDATFEVRIGVHSGSVVAGIVGVKKFSYDIWGDTVNTAARMEQTSEAGKINISQNTYELVKDKFHCTYRGEVEAKNKGLLKMYFVG